MVFPGASSQTEVPLRQLRDSFQLQAPFSLPALVTYLTCLREWNVLCRAVSKNTWVFPASEFVFYVLVLLRSQPRPSTTAPAGIPVSSHFASCQSMWGHDPIWDNCEERRNYLTSIFDQVKIPLSFYHHSIYPSISFGEYEIFVGDITAAFDNCSNTEVSCTLAWGLGHCCSSSNQQENHCRDFRNQVWSSNLLITIIKAN